MLNCLSAVPTLVRGRVTNLVLNHPARLRVVGCGAAGVLQHLAICLGREACRVATDPFGYVDFPAIGTRGERRVRVQGVGSSEERR